MVQNEDGSDSVSTMVCELPLEAFGTKKKDNGMEKMKTRKTKEVKTNRGWDTVNP